MSERAPDLSELHAALSLAQPALISLRYRSALVLDEIVRTMRQLIAPRSLHELRYKPEGDGAEAAAFQLVSDARPLASEEIPVIVLRPKPGADPKSPALAAFWKVINGQRETLGHLNAIVLICLDDAHTGAAYHHARDLLSWCAPKFEFDSLNSIGSTRSAIDQVDFSRQTNGNGGRAMWDSLHPLWRQALASGKPLTADVTTRLVIPLLEAAVANGMVSEGHAFVLEANAAHIAFRDEGQRSIWLDLCGDLAVAQGDLAGALSSFTESKTIRERLAASDSANATWQHDFAWSLIKLGDVEANRGNTTAANAAYQQSQTTLNRLHLSDPSNSGWAWNLSITHDRIGTLAMQSGDRDAAMAAFSKFRDVMKRLATSDPANVAWQRDLSVSLNKLGDLAMAQGDLAGALRSFTDSKTIAERLAASDPTNAAWQRDLSILLERLGNLAVAQGDLAEALRSFTESKAIRECLAASDPANAVWLRDLSVSLNKLGELAVTQGDLAEALRSFAESKTIFERLAARDPANAQWQRDLSVSLTKLGELAVAQGDLAGASRSFTAARAIAECLAARDPANVEWQRDLWVSYVKMATVCEKSQQDTESEGWWKKAFETLAGMKQRGMHLSPKDEGFLERLRAKVGEAR